MKILKLAMICAAITTVSLQASAADLNLRLLSSFDARYPGVPLALNPFIEDIEKRSNGNIDVTVSGPEVVNPFEQLAPVSQGAFDILFTVQPYHAGTSSVSLASYALRPLLEEWRSTGVFDFLDKEYARHNLKLLAVIANTKDGTGAFQYVLKKPLGDSGDFSGLKLRGNRVYQPMIEFLNGSMVTLPGGEIYSALQRGVVDGAAWPVTGAVDFKWYEVSDHMLRPVFGYSYHFVLANMDKWKSLTDEQRNVLTEAGEAIEKTGTDRLHQRQAEEIAKLKELGMKETHLPPEKAGPAIKRFFEGFWESAAAYKASAEQVKAFRAFVEKNGKELLAGQN